MKLSRLALTLSLFLLWSGVASAVPVSFQLDDVTIEGGFFETQQTYSPGLPLEGSGNIDFEAGTGTLTLPDHSLFIDVQLNGDDVRIDLTNWSQTITSIDGSGNITSTGGGTADCTLLPGGFNICGAVPPTVLGWPPADDTLPSSAVIDELLQTITIVDNSSAAGGTITQFYSYSIVPEPSTALLLGGSLAGLGVVARRRRSSTR